MPGLAKRVKERREALKLSQGDLADAMGGKASRLEVSHYECDRRTPSADKLIDLAKALRCSSDYLLGMNERP